MRLRLNIDVFYICSLLLVMQNYAMPSAIRSISGSDKEIDLNPLESIRIAESKS